MSVGPLPPASARGTLTVVGLGIALAGQVTVEALDQIKMAERVFYVVPSAIAGIWLRGLRPDAVSLHQYYGRERLRNETYVAMADRVLGDVQAGHRVCAAFYGHPGVGVDPAHSVMRRARDEGYRVRMLPGVSAEACLYADLGIDPLRTGIQAYEATDFVYRRPTLDTSAALLLWQVGIVGHATAPLADKADPAGLQLLFESLGAYYPLEHEVIVYEASIYPVCGPLIDRVPLSRLVTARVSVSSTLFVPPIPALRHQ